MAKKVIRKSQNSANRSALLKTETGNEVIGIVLIAAGLLLFINLLLVPLNAASDTSKVGAVGVFVARVLAGTAGIGRYFLPLIIVMIGWTFFRNRMQPVFQQSLSGMGIFFLSMLALLHLPVDASDFITYLTTGFQGKGGGVLGAFFCWALVKSFGRIGAQIILWPLLMIGIILATDISLFQLLRKLCQAGNCGYLRIKNIVMNFIYEDESDETPIKTREKKSSFPEKIEDADYPVIITPDYEKKEEKIPLPEPLILSKKEDNNKNTEEKLFEKEPDLVSQPNDAYQLPKTDLLQVGSKTHNPQINKDITDKIRILEDTLESFGVKVKVTQVTCGPAITRYEMQPAPGVKVSKIVSLSDDIALNLAASGVRIEAPIPGKSVIGIEVPKKEISPVCFREVLETAEFSKATSRLTAALGKDISGNPIIADLAAMPHLLIAGSTGSGKSVCMNTLICSVLFKATPAQVKFLMIDPKMVELTNYNCLPHLVAPVVTDAKKAAGALKWVVNEMENRYSIFAANGVKDLTRYNEQKKDSGEELPQILVLIDELADLMMVAPGDVEDSVCRLAQMARAAGIHLIVATQRPSVDVITGLIKANIPSRIAFAVSSQTDSRTILDMGGAEKLLGKGDMLFNPVGAAKPIRVQGVYVSEKEIADIVDYCSNQGKPEYLDIHVPGDSAGDERRAETDELFDESARLVISSGQASISLLQRRFRIGYSRAARLMDMLEYQGVVGGYEGSKPRTVLMSMEQFEKISNDDKE